MRAKNHSLQFNILVKFFRERVLIEGGFRSFPPTKTIWCHAMLGLVLSTR